MGSLVEWARHAGRAWVRAAGVLALAGSVATAGCTASGSEGVRVTPNSAPDPSGDIGEAIPQLDLVSAGIAIDDGTATLTWTVASSVEDVEVDAGTALSWSMVVTDGERGRSVGVRKTSDGSSASVEFASPTGGDGVDLPQPRFEGNTVRLVVPLKTLRWSGRDGDWVVRTRIRRGEEESVDVDEIPSRPFKP